ncbi:ABC transporter ATP-binding protein [Flammeovirga yaeyamensis]|uniref:ABC transporter ATP-binding protein n=1 Tax=Flammeovirga yaeyamensis TaxID=367791 RepID=A0AAX1MZD4_9BACT|nr:MULTISPECIES: ABC transporter ATP-binding protein [Flammeovirga]ANQ47993.2 ABC transporter ATP-binding protein [Flammeovirga sp. MY04]MBB3700844.1 lipoprotein-releasing system ATP-binding protein [Flammeovirga yaeyamensis]NMF37952.1 ABC transporter ATP-binding protein [Flammeovirga yaeyamensis]QWG00604.1 ABC transporter ATP-binding protein [Flammeovirga yaeyamensis]
MLKAKGITKSYGKLNVLKGIDLEIHANEIVSIMGASGAGKSTLLQILGTLDTPKEGSVWIDNEDVTKLNGDKLAQFRNEKIGFVFQFHNLLPEFSALENVCMPALIAGKELEEVKDKGVQLMKMLNIGHRTDHKPSEMSGGEQQRCAIARALINDPLIIFADEPSGNLDSENAEGLHQLFLELRDNFNQTFVIVTHNKELAKKADRQLWMRDGIIENMVTE